MMVFEKGELFIYQNGDKYEIGKVKRPNNDGTGYFCYYHTGDTAVRSGYIEELDGVITVICESALNGIVIRYGNHSKSWQKIGEVIGYA